MPKTIAIRCPHGLPSPGDCPACADDLHSLWQADQLARRSPETVERLQLDFEAWLEGQDACRAEYGDIYPAVCPEVMP